VNAKILCFGLIIEDGIFILWEETMHILKILFLLMILGLPGGCAGVRVSQDYDPDVDLSQLTTFRWESETNRRGTDIRVGNPLLESRIRNAVEVKLADMGFRKISGGLHDFRVGFNYDIRTRYGPSPISVGTGIGVGSRGTFGGIGVGTPVGGRSYDEILMTIDFTDSQQGNLLWRGTGAHRVSTRATPEEMTDVVSTLVERILEQFPVSPTN
jgi:hypothetical protein